MEEIRQARQVEMDAKQDHRKVKLVSVCFTTALLLLTTKQEETKDSLRRKRSTSKRKSEGDAPSNADATVPLKKSKKRVSFG